ncbi:helix-turn-helix domain-containing protein [Aetokthonos hydrillicola Thurmond2011]|jgi:ribosome-binding protein aMBF1 (putative translation factor)|uniref:Helix-turn-helix domain-containing protein n=1 Tax=Aetokthonos hydrillicola Thurmond2011 TaxID=2712845 RepID=A0AAP5I9K1_9CYAN|nr:helix-turn-helix transcriptional regulator [Aetokthonos hydrillicola]MBO3461076.1 helix-turn-helix transcriptional regulator [Aetokthonos hydrillicola CCALA 1050]MBW4586330.1 helix-turn-helix domain-containing protein [Aetokthonos hydrillicola CCALA 1050]MDR9897458.1 helix-turn-helix domain-containing protein [Aetokthonos hydrillicola Thurmond2011]
MILNERQYKITKVQIKKFEEAIEQLNNSALANDENQKLRYRVHLESLQSQLEELREEVEEYEQIKDGKIKCLKLSFDQLPEALIKARIARGLTQEQLAELLKVKAQQVQRDEASKYAGASFTKLLELIKVLNIDVQEEVIFK